MQDKLTFANVRYFVITGKYHYLSPVEEAEMELSPDRFYNDLANACGCNDSCTWFDTVMTLEFAKGPNYLDIVDNVQMLLYTKNLELKPIEQGNFGPPFGDDFRTNLAFGNFASYNEHSIEIELAKWIEVDPYCKWFKTVWLIAKTKHQNNYLAIATEFDVHLNTKTLYFAAS